MKSGAVKEVIYGCIRGLDGRIPECKLGMHANWFNEIKKEWFMILGTGTMVVVIDWTDSKSIAITALEIWVCTSAWWKLKKYCHQKDIGNYPDEYIISLNFFSVGCVSTGKKGNDCMVCSICYNLFSLYIFVILIKSFDGHLFLC